MERPGALHRHLDIARRSLLLDEEEEQAEGGEGEGGLAQLDDTTGVSYRNFALDLAQMAGLFPAGVLCEIVDEKKMDMARVPELERFAEEHGLLWEIDRYVVGRAIAVIGERIRANKPTTLLVKISQASLADDSLPRYIGEQLLAHGVPGEYLVVELAEAKVFTHLKAAQEFAAAAAQVDCRIALENFGAGLDSFQLLAHLKPNMLKIDPSFIDELPANADNQERVREIAGKARELGIQTMADLVSDAATMSVLFGSGVDYVSGNFLAPSGPDMSYDFD